MDLAALMLAAGADVNAHDEAGRTALMHACWRNGEANAVKTLLAADAKLEATDQDGATALLVGARFGERPDVVRTLLAAGADATAKDRLGRDAYELASLGPELEDREVLAALRKSRARRRTG